MGGEPPANGTVVFVHGLWMTGLEMSLLRARVARAGFGTARFHYRSTAGPLADHAARLAAILRTRGRVHVVAHSMGGLVTLAMLRDHVDVEGALVAGREPADWRVRHCIGVVAGTRSLGLGRWIGGLDGRNDGAVSVVETRLDGAADQLELRHSHAAMLLSQRLAREVVAFLHTGRFAGR